MEFLMQLFCTFPNWCRTCSYVVIEKAISVMKVQWEQCAEKEKYNMTVKNSAMSLLYEGEESCCGGSIVIRYVTNNRDEIISLMTNGTGTENNTTNFRTKEDDTTKFTLITIFVVVATIFALVILGFLLIKLIKKKSSQNRK
ncbi:uncharacterized protein LOC134278188 [Saccostrea cucullata]|uniref:uncharacterized protein LOC134278188 n=1 Tax=Saccostrea cuccullata TaxID=36930 RepID=UPI002ED5C877